jgi:hypothetical protein
MIKGDGDLNHVCVCLQVNHVCVCLQIIFLPLDTRADTYLIKKFLSDFFSPSVQSANYNLKKRKKDARSKIETRSSSRLHVSGAYFARMVN